MATIVYRTIPSSVTGVAPKTTPLTNAEIDYNFFNLNSELTDEASLLTKIKTVDGTGSGLDADLLDGLNSSAVDTTGNSIVSRSSGNFSAGTITASFVGNISGGTVSASTGTFSGITSITNATASTTYTNGALVVTGGVGLSSNLNTNGYINRVTGNGNACWMQQDGQGRNHWYWNTYGGINPTYTNSGEDAANLTLHVTNNGNGGVLRFRSASGSGKTAGQTITWTDVLYADLTSFSFLGNPVVTSANFTSYTASRATNLVGGNTTTLLGSIPYQSDTNVTTLLAPNTSTTKRFLRQTGTGTNGAAPVWDTLTSADVGLSNVTNESKSTMFASPNFTGTATYNSIEIGYRTVPQTLITSGYTLSLTDNAKHIYYTGAAATINVPTNALVAFPIGTALTIINNGTGVITVSATGITLFLAGTTSTGNRSIGIKGMATLIKVATDTWFITGSSVY